MNLEQLEKIRVGSILEHGSTGRRAEVIAITGDGAITERSYQLESQTFSASNSRTTVSTTKGNTMLKNWRIFRA